MAINVTNPEGFVEGTSGDDFFRFTAIGNTSIAAGAGSDTLIVEGPQPQFMDVGVSDFFGTGSFNIRIVDLLGGSIFGDDIERVFIAGSTASDRFLLQKSELSLGNEVVFAAAAGDDQLTLELEQVTSNIVFEYDAVEIVSNVGTFSGFESFTIVAGAGDDVLRTGAGRDDIRAGGGTNIIESGAGSDSVYTQSITDFTDGGAGEGDSWTGSYGASVEGLTVEIGSEAAVNGRVVAINVENYSVGGGAGDDLFQVTAAIQGSIFGDAGRDALVFDGAMLTIGLDIRITALFDGTLEGGIGALSVGGIESFDITGTQANDLFTIVLDDNSEAMDVDGFDGTDTLSLSFAQSLRDVQFEVLGDGAILSDRGSFASFEQVSITGGSGNDRFVTQGGVDQLVGGDGDDFLDAGADGDYVAGDGGDDRIFGGAGGDALYGGTGADTIDGGDGDDLIFAGENFGFGALDIEADRIDAGAGDDRIAAGFGDIIDGGTGFDALSLDLAAGATSGVTLDLGLIASGGTAQVGTGSITGIERFETITLTDFDDVVMAAPGASEGLIVNAGGGSDTVVGTALDDQLSGGNGDDDLVGGDGNDQLSGGQGADRLDGGAGNDNIRAGDLDMVDDEIDVILAGDGDDNIVAGFGDSVDGGDGFDGLLLDFYSGGPTTGVTLDLRAIDETGSFNLGSGTVRGIERIDQIGLTAFDDRIVGTDLGQAISGFEGDDRIAGGSGVDILFGGWGDDVLVGGDGDDQLYGDVGNNDIEGGAGNDFVFLDSFRADATITYDGHALVITSQTGVDRVSGVETISFFDGIFTATELLGEIADIPSGYILTTSAGLSAMVSGTGTVVGTAGFEEIIVRDSIGQVMFDASFNGGGDRIVLDGDAATYTVRRTGSSVEIADANTTVVIPVGPQGIDLVFGDGTRTLVFDLAAGTVQLSDQVVGDTAAVIVAGVADPVASGILDADAVGAVALTSGARAVVGGNLVIFGSQDANTVELLSGSSAIFDPSFNRGGDVILLPGTLDGYSAVRSGSSIIIDGDDGSFTIPFGTVGSDVTIDGDAYTLVFDQTDGTLRFGDLEIGTVPVALDTALAAPDVATFAI